MKKTLLSVILAVFSLCCVSAEYSGYILQTSFEDGKLPDGWRQEYVSGNQPWKIENSNLEYPIGAFDGNYRLALRNEQGVTLGFKTRLILPVLDLSNIQNEVNKTTSSKPNKPEKKNGLLSRLKGLFTKKKNDNEKYDI